MTAPTRYLALGPGCFGIDKLPGQAVGRMKKAYPAFFKAERPNPDYNLYEVQEDAHVDMQGNIITATPPLWVRSVTWVAGKRVTKDMKRVPLSRNSSASKESSP